MDIKVIASGSDGNCYRVSDGSSTVLLDAGVPIKAIRAGCDFHLAEVAGCLVTHSHSDHSKAVKDIIRAGVPAYMTAGEAELVPGAVRIIERAGEAYIPFRVGTFTVVPFHVEHDTPEPVGFFLGSTTTNEKLLYFTDTYYIRQRFAPFEYLIGEVNYDEETVKKNVEEQRLDTSRMKRLFTTHMGLNTFLEFLRANDISRLRKIWVCHMSNDNGNAERIEKAIERETGIEVYVC